MELKVQGRCDGENDPELVMFDDRRVDLILVEVQSRYLGEALRNKAGLVNFLLLTVSWFELKCPSASDDGVIRGESHYCPGSIFD